MCAFLLTCSDPIVNTFYVDMCLYFSWVDLGVKLTSPSFYIQLKVY